MGLVGCPWGMWDALENRYPLDMGYPWGRGGGRQQSTAKRVFGFMQSHCFRFPR
jgi:hypothetical protein